MHKGEGGGERVGREKKKQEKGCETGWLERS